MVLLHVHRRKKTKKKKKTKKNPPPAAGAPGRSINIKTHSRAAAWPSLLVTPDRRTEFEFGCCTCLLVCFSDGSHYDPPTAKDFRAGSTNALATVPIHRAPFRRPGPLVAGATSKTALRRLCAVVGPGPIPPVGGGVVPAQSGCRHDTHFQIPHPSSFNLPGVMGSRGGLELPSFTPCA